MMVAKKPFKEMTARERHAAVAGSYGLAVRRKKANDRIRREIGDDLSCWLDEPAKGALGFRSL